LPWRERRGRRPRRSVRRRSSPVRPGAAGAGSNLMARDASIGAGIDATGAAVADVLDAARAELESLVRIPSISADPHHHPDVRASADATVELLRAHGLENVRTAGVEGSQPFVLGEWLHAGPESPTVLLYAHHDVQT